MDSCNSGSLQSSSGGDEEYDSRAAVNFSAFMTTQPINPVPPPQQQLLFDSLSNYFLNPNTHWTRPATPISDPNGLVNSFIPSFQPPSLVGAENNNNSLTTAQTPSGNQNQAVARNPKKRSRASRRAPTTVLTTDTTNFRAMVQEFTGIPAPPFHNSPYQRTRLDLFGGRSSFSDSAPPYLLRPFAQKAQPPPQVVAQPQPSYLVASSSTTNSVSSTDIPITQSSNLFNISNPFLQSNPKFPFSESSLEMGSRNQFADIPSSDHLNSVKLGGFGDFSLGRHGNLVASINQQIPSTYPRPTPQRISPNMQNDILNDNNSNSSNVGSWGSNPVRREGNGSNQAQPVNGNFEFSRNTNTMMTSFNGEKGPENNGVGTRGEGMVESWINCTNSD